MTMFPDWLRPKPRLRPKCAPKSSRCRLAVERLDPRIVPAVFTVNSVLDTDDGQPFDAAGVTTLRKAVRLSNLDQVVDTITFSPELANETIVLSGGEMIINKPTQVIGPANSMVTIDGDNQSRIFHIDSQTQTRVAVSLSRLRLTGGRENDGNPQTIEMGGAIRNRENLTILGCIFEDNTDTYLGGAIGNAAGAFLTITDSTLTKNTSTCGGAIYNEGQTTVERVLMVENEAGLGGAICVDKGTVDVIDSVLAGNAAGGGGAVANLAGAVTIVRSTVSDNVATDNGGGIKNNSKLVVTDSTISGNSTTDAFGDGGGGVFNTGTTTVSNSTVSGNMAILAGGGIWNNGSLRATNCTIVANRVVPGNTNSGSSGGIHTTTDQAGTFGISRIDNTIVAGNIAEARPDLGFGMDLASSFNIIGDPQSAGGLSNGVNGNIVGRTKLFQQVLLPLESIVDPVLRNNGGPTPTHALFPRSAAVGKGDDHFATASDQRGLERIVGVNVDVGACELAQPLFTDHFTRPDGVNLGTPWVTRAGKFAVVDEHAESGAAGANLAVLRSLSAADIDMSADIFLAANQQAGLVARYSGPGDRNYYLAALALDEGGNRATLRLLRNVNGVVTELAAAENLTDGTLRFRLIGSRLEVYMNRVLVATADDQALRSGSAGIRTVGAAPVDTLDILPATTGVDQLDTFKQSDDTTLGGHWAQPVGSFRVNVNIARGETATNLAVLNGVRSADIDVHGDFAIVGRNRSAGLIARYQGAGDRNYYLGKLTRTDTGFIAQVVKNMAGINTVLSSRTIDTPTGNAVLRFLVTGSNLRRFINGTLVADVLDHSLTTGSAGIRTDQGVLIDNFRATGVAPAALPFAEAFVPAALTGLSTDWTRAAGKFSTLEQRAVGGPGVNLAVLTGLRRTDYSLSADVALPAVNDQVGLVANYGGKGNGNYYLARATRMSPTAVRLSIVKNVGGRMTTLKSRVVPDLAGPLGFVVSRNQLHLLMNQTSLLKVIDNTFRVGSVGIRTVGGGSLDNFAASELPSLPFNDPFAAPPLGAAWVKRAGKFALSNSARGLAAVNFATVGRMSIGDVLVKADINVPAVGGRFASLVARASGPGDRNMYRATIRREASGFVAQITKDVNGASTTLGAAPVGDGTGRLEFHVVGSVLTLTFDGAERLSVVDFNLTSGSIGIRSSRDGTLANFSGVTPGS
jgi:hypothetical protein